MRSRYLLSCRWLAVGITRWHSLSLVEQLRQLRKALQKHKLRVLRAHSQSESEVFNWVKGWWGQTRGRDLGSVWKKESPQALPSVDLELLLPCSQQIKHVEGDAILRSVSS